MAPDPHPRSSLPRGVRRAFRLLARGWAGREVDEELRFHLDERARRLEAAGMEPRAARREAERRFGDVRAVRERCLAFAQSKERTVHLRDRLDQLARDLAGAARGLSRRPGFTAAAVATLALGLGANAAVFRAVEAVALRPLPFPEPEELVAVRGTVEREGVELRAASYPEVRDWRRGVSAFESLAAVTGRTVTLTRTGTEGAGEARRVRAALADPEYFDAVGIEPFLGRALESADNAPPEGLPHAVVGHALWQRELGGDRSALGRRIEVEGVAFEVIGVMPEGFAGTGGRGELWLPIRSAARFSAGFSDEDLFEDRGSRGLGVLARLAPGASVARAQAELDAVSARMAEEYPEDHTGRGARAIPLREAVFGDARESSWLLLGAVALVWLVACVNVANLLLARMADRGREIAIRTSLGATRGRLGFQVLAEALVLAVLGTAAGLLLAAWARDLLAAWRPDDLPSYAAAEAAGPVVVYLLGLTVATALLLAAIPLAGVLRRDPAKGLGSGRGAEGGGSRRGARSHLRRLLVGAQVAVAAVVLVGAGLLVRSFRAQAAIEPGFDAEGLVAASVRLPEARYDDAAARSFAGRLEERLAALPGVRSAALGSDIPLVSGYSATFVRAAERYAEDPEHRIRVYFHRVTPGFFATAGIRMLAGRTFAPVPPDADPVTSGEEVVVSRRLAETAWPGESPLGKHLLLGERAPYAVVGVVEPVRYRALTPDPANPEDPDLYLPLAGNPPRRLALFVETAAGRTGGSAGGVEVPLAALQAAVAELDPALPLFDAGPLAEAVRRETAVARFSSILFGLFGALAAVLAVVGVYGVMAYSVARRRREVGVRMALGAPRGRILRLVLGEGTAVAVGGVTAGIAAALLLGRALRRLLAESLYGTAATDPVIFAAVGLGLAVTVLAASWLPARRAAGVDPAEVMRAE